MLPEDRRKQLDDIVQKMTVNKESDSNIRFVVDDFKKKYTPTKNTTEPVSPVKPSYLQRVGGQYAEAGNEIVSGIKEGADQYAQGVQGGNPIQATGGLLRSGLRAAGGVAKAAFAPIVEAPGIKQAIDKIGQGIASVPGADDVIAKAGEISKKYPNASKDVQNIIDIVTLGGGKVIEKPLIGEARALSSDINQAAKAVLTPSEEAIQSKVTSLFQKSIKPTAKKTLALNEKYENNILEALKTIKNNAEELNIQDSAGEIVAGRTPQTINELAQGVDQTKKAVFKQYDDLAKQAGKGGAQIDAFPIVKELETVTQSKALELTSPEVIKYAKNWADRLKKFGSLDTETTQEVIKIMNNNLEAFYRNPTYDTASRVAIDAGIANNFRSALDKAIEGATGKEYQALKNKYGALKAIENDVTKAAMRDARKNVKGLLDYTDIFTSGQMLSGILSLNPAMFTKGAVERGFKEYIKMLNDPNRAVKNIFDHLEKTPKQSFTPKSATGKFLQNPKMGLSVEDTSRKIKIKPDDVGEMRDFLDYKNGAYVPSDKEAFRLEKAAADIAEKYKLTTTKSQDRLAQIFGKYLDRVGFDKKVR
jgi:hypothetical protein